MPAFTPKIGLVAVAVGVLDRPSAHVAETPDGVPPYSDADPKAFPMRLNDTRTAQ